MEARLVSDHSITGFTDRLNTSALAECIMGFDHGDMDSMFFNEVEVLLENGTWKNLNQAFKDRDVITDNYNTIFRETLNDEERERGWFN